MKKYKGNLIRLVLIIILMFLLITYYYVEVCIKPTLSAISEVQAKVIASRIINETVINELNNAEIKNQIFVPSYDRDGKINMIRIDALIMNNISNDIAIITAKNNAFNS